MEQLGLIDMETGSALVPAVVFESSSVKTTDNYIENDCSFGDLLEIARNFGAEQQRLLGVGKLSTERELCTELARFLDTTCRLHELDSGDRAKMRNALLAGASMPIVRNRFGC